MSARLSIIKAGTKLPTLSSVAGDFDDWTRWGMGEGPAEAAEVVAVCEGASLPLASDMDGVIVTGSAAMVTDSDAWIDRTAHWLAEAVARDVPVLGICFGHQLLAHALGGEVADNPAGVEVGTVTAMLTEPGTQDPLLGPGAPAMPVQTSHQQRVMCLPDGAVLLATTARDPCHAFRYGTCAWGVQFHPEFSADVTRAYVRYYQQQDKLDAEQITAPVTDTPVASAVLRRFAEYVAQ